MTSRTIGAALVSLTLVALAACSAAPDDEVVSEDGLAESTECSGAAILARIPEGPRHDAVARAVWRVGSKPPYDPNRSSGGYRNDCSGFTAAAWLDRNQPSTGAYPPFAPNASFVEVPFDQLQPGDALNRKTRSSCKIGTCGHIRLFGGFVDAEKTRFCVLEHAAPYGAPPVARLGKAEDLAYLPIKNVSLPDVGPNTPPPPPSLPPTTTTGCGALGVDEALGVNEAKTSCDGRYSLVMQGDGNLVLYRAGVALWNTQTVGRGGAALVMQNDGNLVMYQNGTGKAVWNTGTAGHAGATLAVQDDGNVVLYDGGKALWSTGTAGR